MSWMTKEPNKWNARDLKSFILDQNGYSHDGERPQRHSAQSLASFACLNTAQTAKLVTIYNELYSI